MAMDPAFPASTAYGNKVIHLEVPNRLSDLQMRQAILNASYQNGWEVTQSGQTDDAVLVQTSRKTPFAESNFTFLAEPGLIEVYSNYYALDITGKRTRRYTPPVRINTIRDSLRENLEKALAAY